MLVRVMCFREWKIMYNPKSKVNSRYNMVFRLRKYSEVEFAVNLISVKV